MLRRSPIARFDRAAVARKLTATLLVLALVSSYASLASALSHAKMPCCEMAAHHKEGGAECVGHSCHTKPPAPPKAAKKEPNPSDPVCGADAAAKTPAKPSHAAHNSHHTPHTVPHNVPDAVDDSPHPHASHNPAEAHNSSQTHGPSQESGAHKAVADNSDAHNSGAVNSDTHEASSSSAHSHAPAAHPTSLAASVSKPCPPDCSTGASSTTNRTSRREHAANSSTHAPRASLQCVSPLRAAPPSDLSADKRRQTRPRAPPSALVS